MPKFGHFGPKSINFLILTKFCLYPILKVLISNLTLLFENQYNDTVVAHVSISEFVHSKNASFK